MDYIAGQIYTKSRIKLTCLFKKNMQICDMLKERLYIFTIYKAFVTNETCVDINSEVSIQRVINWFYIDTYLSGHCNSPWHVPCLKHKPCVKM